jgi:hypothetical protein
LREIARAVEAGGGFLDIKGVAVPALEGTRFSTLRRNTDLKESPFPDRSLPAGFSEDNGGAIARQRRRRLPEFPAARVSRDAAELPQRGSPYPQPREACGGPLSRTLTL